MKLYILKKGAADPFRGDWYLEEESFERREDAVAKAASLTLSNYREWKMSWEEFGYEWSVFERTSSSEVKVWEGFKYIRSASPNEDELPDFKFGNL
jgi:hypothetical protein